MSVELELTVGARHRVGEGTRVDTELEAVAGIRDGATHGYR